MRRVLEIWLVQLLLLGYAVGTEEQTNAKALVIDVYSVKASGVTEQKSFALWARDLREGKASLTQYQKILHAEYPLAEAFDIANEAQAEADAPKFVVAGHVAPRVEQGAYKITFSELDRPPAGVTLGIIWRAYCPRVLPLFSETWHPSQEVRTGPRFPARSRDCTG